MPLLAGNSEAIRQLCTFLGLPNNVVAFTLRVRVGELARIEVEQYVEEPPASLSICTQQFELTPIEERRNLAPTVEEDDSWLIG